MEEEKNGSGVCVFAYNNDQLDYVKMAMIAALYAKRNLSESNNDVTLITSKGDWEWLQQSQPEAVVSRAFDNVVLTTDELKQNERTHYDSPWTKFKTQFNNSNKHKVWEYSPYEKTLLIDVDYLIHSGVPFNDAFDNDDGVTMYSSARDLGHRPARIFEQYLTPTGIPMWWSTVVYFDRSDISEMFFGLWSHVADNYEYYRYLYNFPGKMFRTDFCVSIATHIMNGMHEGDMINKFMDGDMVFMDQRDDIVEIRTPEEFIYLVNDREEPWKDVLAKYTNTNVHCMNKRSLDRHFDRMLELL